jgi:hypothetical protein
VKIERDKWYLTRAGKKMRVVCVDAPDDQPVVAIDTVGNVYRYDADGLTWADGNVSIGDLHREYKEPREWFINRYRGGGATDGYLHSTKKLADDNAGPSRVECIRVREVLED